MAGQSDRHKKPVNIKKWPKPLPKLDLRPGVQSQQASRDLAVHYWQRIYGDSEARCEEWTTRSITCTDESAPSCVRGAPLKLSSVLNYLIASQNGLARRRLSLGAYVLGCNLVLVLERSSRRKEGLAAWGRVQVAGGWVSFVENEGKGRRGWGGWGVGWGPALEPAHAFVNITL